MAVAEKTGQEILLEQLAQRVGTLAAEQKAKESAIKELNTQIKLTEADSAMKIRGAQEVFERKRTELAAAIAPLEALNAECAARRAELKPLQQAKLDAVADIKAAKGLEIKAAQEAVAKATARLAKIETAIQHCKSTVANL